MAMSFSRPDPSSPASVADAAFATGRRGFDQGEVRDFLRMVAAELGRLQERERFLERELRSAQSNPDLSSARLDDEALTRLLGEETARVLQTARESANEIRDKAEGAAGRLLSEASEEARRLREEAEVESARRRADAAADAEAELDMAKQQGREMVNEARAYRERVLSELARRRELAREQIEQLVHGRDRLMQAFERARLVAVDIVSEMQPLGEPNEYVNLDPTTGPVPVMVANSPRPEATESGRSDPVEETTGGQPGADDTSDGETDLTSGAAIDGGPADAESAPEADDAVSEQDTADDGEADGPNGDEPAVGGPDGVVSDIGEAASDDVVVDLFARIRADARQEDAELPEEPAAAAGDDAIWGTTAAPSDADAAAADDTTDAEISDANTSDAELSDADRPASAFEQRDEDLTPLIVASAKKLKRVLADEQNGVLDALRRHHPVRELDDLLPASGDHAARYGDAIADDLRAAARAGAASVGRKTALPKAQSADAIRVATDGLDHWLVAPLRDRLQRCVSEGDGDNDAITKKVRAAYREWKTKHIDEQLDDVLMSAYGRGVLAGVGAGDRVSWGVDRRHEACADCDDNALAGAIAAGEPFPTGDTFAPAHPGCRCLLVPDRR